MAGRGPAGQGPGQKPQLGIPPGQYKQGRTPDQRKGWKRGKAWWKGEPDNPGPSTEPPGDSISEPKEEEVVITTGGEEVTLPPVDVAPEGFCPTWAHDPAGWPPSMVNPPCYRLTPHHVLRTASWFGNDYFTRCHYYHPLDDGMLNSDGSIAAPGDTAFWEVIVAGVVREVLTVEVTPAGLEPYGIFPGTYSHPADVWCGYLWAQRTSFADPREWLFLWPTALDDYPERWESEWSGLSPLNPEVIGLSGLYDRDDNGNPYQFPGLCHQYWARIKAQAEFPDFVYGQSPLYAHDYGQGYLDYQANGMARFGAINRPANPLGLRNDEYEIPAPPDFAALIAERLSPPTYEMTPATYPGAGPYPEAQMLGGWISDAWDAVSDAGEWVYDRVTDAVKGNIKLAAQTAPMWAMAASAATGVPPQVFVLGANKLNEAVNGSPQAIAEVQAAGLPTDQTSLQAYAAAAAAQSRKQLLLFGGLGALGLALLWKRKR